MFQYEKRLLSCVQQLFIKSYLLPATFVNFNFPIKTEGEEFGPPEAIKAKWLALLPAS